MERELVSWLQQRLRQSNRIVVGPGDDAAILSPSAGKRTVVTTDMLMDGVDFRLAEHDLRRIGRKALAVNLSDLAAMAATPIAAFVSLAIPRSLGIDDIKLLYEGMLPLAERYGVSIAGGDTNSWDAPLCISVTALGEVDAETNWRRSGAQVGDWILVTGELGGSILRKHFDFEPRICEALEVARQYEIHAAMDISDGLTLDLSRLCEASGSGALIELARIPIADDAIEVARTSARSALDHALGDGEDFELILVLSEQEAQRLLRDQPNGIPLTHVGNMVSESGLWARDDTELLTRLEPRGYLH